MSEKPLILTTVAECKSCHHECHCDDGLHADEYGICTCDECKHEEDYRYSGQYVITKIRHQITSDIYTMVLECAKDSVVNPITPGEPQYKANKRKGDLEDIYDSGTNIYNRHN